MPWKPPFEHVMKELEDLPILNLEDLIFLQENLHYAQMSYEDKSGQYRFGPQKIEGYYEKDYLPKIKQFQEMKKKLSAMTKWIRAHGEAIKVKTE